MPLTLLAALLLFQGVAPETAFVRSTTLPGGKIELRTAARKLTAAGKPDIWLVSTVHVARPDYYKALQKLLDAQKLVLFEGVDDAPEQASVDEETDPQEDFYGSMAKALGLQSQMAGIDYERPNWWNCDLSLADLDRLNKQIGKGKPNGYDYLKAVRDPGTKEGRELVGLLSKATSGVAEALKIMIIRRGEGRERTLDPAYDAIVLKARNDRVLDAVADILKAPPAPASVALFYGAGHMPAMQKALLDRHGYQPAQTLWFVAMDADPKKLDKDGKKLLDSFMKSHPPLAPAKGKG